MPVSQNAVVHQAILQVVYGEGIVYLDHCGSLSRDLQKILGKGFRFALPSVQQGLMRSVLERLTLTYGPESLGVVQEGVHEVARFAQVSNWAWRETANSLEVGKKVSRCGIRFIQLFETQSAEEAEEALLRSGLLRETEPWTGLFGPCASRSFVGVSRGSGWTSIRSELASKTIEMVDDPPAEMKPFLPRFSVSLDTDFVLVENGPSELSYVDLKEAVLRAWTEARKLASAVGERISGA
jgi:hypothetical protein